MDQLEEYVTVIGLSLLLGLVLRALATHVGVVLDG